MARRNRPRRGRDQPRHRFRSRPGDPRKQAADIVKRLQGSRINQCPILPMPNPRVPRPDRITELDRSTRGLGGRFYRQDSPPTGCSTRLLDALAMVARRRYGWSPQSDTGTHHD